VPATFTDIAKSRYVLLTTFTKDGRPKPTPIWVAPNDDQLLAITGADSWKVKRVRNNPQVTLAACNLRGKPTSESVQAVATVLDESETADAHRAIVKRYGLIGQMFNLYNRLRGNHLTDVGIEIKPVAASRR
jgi:uncharacterized protein